MTAGQHQDPRGPGSAVVRPHHHIEAVRGDAVTAARRRAATTGAEPNCFITDAISWAVGEGYDAPFTETPAPGGADHAEVAAEISACTAFLESTPWSEQAADAICRARQVLELLKWLTGAQDNPPTYCRETEPGDLVGGRGRIVRPEAEIRRMLALAEGKLAAGQTSYALGADWHQGVIVTLQWTRGDRMASPMYGVARAGLPDGARIAIEQSEAEDHLVAPLRSPDIPLHVADAVALTCRWLLGDTTQPPVSDDD